MNSTINKPSFKKQLKAGEERAFITLFGIMSPLLIKFFKRKMGAEDAEELANDVMVKVSKSLHSFDPDRSEPIESFIMTIAKRTRIDQIRRRAARKFSPPDLLELLKIDRASTSLATEELLNLIKTAIDSLGEADRNIVTKRLVRVPYKQIAEEEGIRVGAARKQFQRAKDKIVCKVKDLIAAYEKK